MFFGMLFYIPDGQDSQQKGNRRRASKKSEQTRISRRNRKSGSADRNEHAHEWAIIGIPGYGLNG
jgi:hypothetical protein